MKVAIHQPNFLPWLGFFHKISLSDIFVLFDDVQFPRGKTYSSRTKIKTFNGPQWISVPIASKGGLKTYRDTKIAASNWQRKSLKTIEIAYKKAPFFDKYFEEFKIVFSIPHETIFEPNYALIKFVLEKLSIDTILVMSSDLCKGTSLNGEEKILFILKEVGASQYISGEGAGSKRYINEDDFKANNFELVYQKFEHPEYPQLYGEFMSNLSVLDLLFNCGDKSEEILLG